MSTILYHFHFAVHFFSIHPKRRTFGGVDRTWDNREYNLMVLKAMETNHYDYVAILTLARYAGLRLLKEQRENKKLFGNCYTDSGYIFTKADGTPYYPSYPTHELQKVLKKHELPHIRWHDLRHTTASLLILKGWQMKEISEWLGHADITTTMNIYGHINLDHKRKLGETLNGIFKQSV